MAEFQDLKTAVAENFFDGDTAIFEGFTHLIPHAAAHEAIRQGRRELTLIRMTPDLVYDQMTIGFLDAAQIDRFGNINTTVIGDYDRPKTRLPGGGGAPEIASSTGEIYVTLKQSLRAMVDRIDFYTSFGHDEGGDHRQRKGMTTKGPTLLITDLAIWKPDLETREFTVVSLYPGVSRDDVQASCGWPVRFADAVEETPAPSDLELKTLRDLKARTKAAHHAGAATVPTQTDEAKAAKSPEAARG